jgi:hypothetical protein
MFDEIGSQRSDLVLVLLTCQMYLCCFARMMCHAWKHARERGLTPDVKWHWVCRSPRVAHDVGALAQDEVDALLELVTQALEQFCVCSHPDIGHHAFELSLCGVFGLL